MFKVQGFSVDGEVLMSEKVWYLTVRSIRMFCLCMCVYYVCIFTKLCVCLSVCLCVYVMLFTICV